MVLESRLLQKLIALYMDLDVDQYRFIFGDATYGASYRVIGPYKNTRGHVIINSKRRFNKALAAYRIIIKYSFRGIKE